MALSDCSRECMWIRNMFKELGYVSRPIPICSDNQGALFVSQNAVTERRTKHIDIRFHFIRQTAERGDIIVHDCRTDDMIADIFTKPLGRVKFEKFRFLLGMESHAA